MVEPTAIKLLIFDVDGVLTDGAIYVNDLGIETKRFNVRDGFAIKAAPTLGLKIGVLTGRSTPAVTLRMAELDVDLVLQGSHQKADGLRDLCRKAAVTPHETAYVGDDLIDLPAMGCCGYPIAVADACPQVLAAARYVTRAAGGSGAGREAIEHILERQGRWAQLLSRYAQAGNP